MWRTGLSTLGKFPLSTMLEGSLEDSHGPYVEILDGDEVENGLSRELNLSKEDREEQTKRASYVARVLARNDVVAIVALISPYPKSRAEAREIIGPKKLVEVYIRAPLSVCEERDPKGLCAKARRGEIHNMTGIQGPYEEPTGPDLAIDTPGATPEDCGEELVSGLRRLGKI